LSAFLFILQGISAAEFIPTFAMQKVEGSSPFSRFVRKPSKPEGFSFGRGSRRPSAAFVTKSPPPLQLELRELRT
jgi:hypothetical protein